MCNLTCPRDYIHWYDSSLSDSVRTLCLHKLRCTYIINLGRYLFLAKSTHASKTSNFCHIVTVGTKLVRLSKRAKPMIESRQGPGAEAGSSEFKLYFVLYFVGDKGGA